MFFSSSDPVSKYYLEMFFANPEIVAKANIPNSAKPSNIPAPWLTPAPTATKIESLINKLISNAGVNILHLVPPIPIA